MFAFNISKADQCVLLIIFSIKLDFLAFFSIKLDFLALCSLLLINAIKSVFTIKAINISAYRLKMRCRAYKGG
ncbi:hypothetical protein DD769_08070 [Helicobacter pylori]|nr:hypothetical protein DD769_08070 [Helicobacter pylori]